MSARPDRRSLLLAALGMAGAALAGCSDRSGGGPSPTRSDLPAAPGSAQVDLQIQAAAVAAERELIVGCQAALLRHPALRGRLRPVLDDHTAHLFALGAPAPQPASPARPHPAAATAAAALRHLAEAEQVAARARLDQCVAARSGRFAQLLASLAAAEALHAQALA